MAQVQPEQLVILILEHLGAQVRKVPHASSRTPDFIATLRGVRYLSELKAKRKTPLVKESEMPCLIKAKLQKTTIQ